MFTILYGFFLLTGLAGLILNSGSVLFDLLLVALSLGGLCFILLGKKHWSRSTRIVFASVILIILLGLSLVSGAGTVSRYPDQPLALNQQLEEVRTALSQGKTQRAADLLENISAHHPSSDRVNLYRALTALQQGDTETAADALRAVTTVDSAEYRFLAGVLRFYQGDFSKALTSLESAVTADGDWYQALLFAGVLNLEQDDLQDGEALIDLAASLQPSAQLPRYYQAVIAHDHLDSTRATALFNQLKKEDLPPAMVHNIDQYLRGESNTIPDPLLLELLAETCLAGLPF